MVSLYGTSSRLSGLGCGCTLFQSPHWKTAKMGTKAELLGAIPLINDAAFQNLGKKKRLCSVIRDTLGEKLNLVSCNLAFIPALPDYFPDGAGQLCSIMNEALKLSHRWESLRGEVRATTQRETWTESPNVRQKTTEVTSAELIESSNTTLPFRKETQPWALQWIHMVQVKHSPFLVPSFLSSGPLSFRPTSWSGIIKAVVRAAACTCANKH